MEVRDYAESIVKATTLAEKLAAPPADLLDDEPGSPLRIDDPQRPPNLTIDRKRRIKVPPMSGWADPSQRVRILHAFANHELQAAELFAWALLFFADAPKAFRRGLLKILVEEQQHCSLYIKRMQELGHHFGDFPVSAHFWNKAVDINTPLHFICAMGLTFENANLDFAHEYSAAARACGDVASAEILDLVHREEVSHVAFAWHWFNRFRDTTKTPWQSYLAHVPHSLGPGRARGKAFIRASRVAAGLDSDFINELEQSTAVRPNGHPR